MFSSYRSVKTWAINALSWSFVYSNSVAMSQDFSLRGANTDPLGFLSVLPSTEKYQLGFSNGMKGTFGYGVAMEAVFDSNFNLSEDNPESEVTLNLMPWLGYSSDPEEDAPFIFNFKYQPIFRSYDHNPALNGVDQNMEVSMQLEGSRTLITAFSKYSQFSGTDRLSRGFVEGYIITSGIQAGYQIAPRTNLFGNLTVSSTDYSSSNTVGADYYTTQVGANWSATERLDFGPSVRYILTKSANTGTRDAWALLMQAQYLAGERIRLQGSLGFEYALNSGDGESSTINITGDFEAGYVLNDKWIWTNTLQYATVPSPTESGYLVNNLQLISVLSRNLLRATVGLGVEYNLSDFQAVGKATQELASENDLSIYVVYNRKLFSDRIDFESKVRYGLNQGDIDWRQLQLSLGVILTF